MTDKRLQCDCVVCGGTDKDARCVNQLSIPGTAPLDNKTIAQRGGRPDETGNPRRPVDPRFHDARVMTDDKIVRQQAEVVMVDDFYAYMPMHSYLFVPSREMWPASSVNARLQSPDGEGKASGSTVIVR